LLLTQIINQLNSSSPNQTLKVHHPPLTSPFEWFC
jgi:hypothetical protein